MKMGRPLQPLNLSDEVRSELNAISGSRILPHSLVRRETWLNQVEIWFNIITQKAIRRGSFRSVKDLVNNIKKFADHYNSNSKPFVWTATAESILEKIKRLFELIGGTRH